MSNSLTPRQRLVQALEEGNAETVKDILSALSEQVTPNVYRDVLRDLWLRYPELANRFRAQAAARAEKPARRGTAPLKPGRWFREGYEGPVYSHIIQRCQPLNEATAQTPVWFQRDALARATHMDETALQELEQFRRGGGLDPEVQSDLRELARRMDTWSKKLLALCDKPVTGPLPQTGPLRLPQPRH